jgi:TonB family protein
MSINPKGLLKLLITVAACWSIGVSQGRIVVSSSSPTQKDLSEWQTFSSPEGRFSILFPGTPVSRVSEVQTSSGRVTVHTVTLKLPESFYHVSYLDYPNYVEGAEFTKKSLDAGRDGMLARNQGTKLLAERPITIGSFHGREFLILQDGISFGIMETYVVRGRLYELAILVPAEVAFSNGKVTTRPQDRTEYFDSIANKFFASFEAPEVTETMGEVERVVRELRRNNTAAVVTMAPGATEPGSQASITSGVLNGRAIHLVTPAYPSVARSAHAAGTVRIQVLIGLDGNVIAAQAVDGHPLLRAAAVKAARESKFTPTTLEGKPVMVNGIIIYNFVAH